jgi:hypothetical protein
VQFRNPTSTEESKAAKPDRAFGSPHHSVRSFQGPPNVHGLLPSIKVGGPIPEH